MENVVENDRRYENYQDISYENLTAGQRFIWDCIYGNTYDATVRDKHDKPVIRRFYPNVETLKGYLKRICNRKFLANASQSLQECVSASLADIWRRADEIYALPTAREQAELLQRIIRTATFKNIRSIPEVQGTGGEDDFSGPTEVETSVWKGETASLSLETEEREPTEPEFYEVEDLIIARIDAERQSRHQAPEPPTEYDCMALRLGKADADWLWDYQTDAQESHRRARKPKSAADRNRALRLRSRL
jgi:hypothetical protein